MTSTMRQAHQQPGPRNDTVGDEPQVLPSSDDIQIIPDASTPVGNDVLSEKGLGRLTPVENHPLRVLGSTLRAYLLIGDIVALAVAWGVLAWASDVAGLAHALSFVTIAVLVTLAAMQCAGLYRSRVCAQRSLEAVRAVTACIIGTTAFILCDALVGHLVIIGPLVAGAAAAMSVLLVRWRFSRWLRIRRSASKFLRTVIMVGTNEDAHALWTLLNEEPELGYRVGGVAGELDTGAPWESLPNCDSIYRLGELAVTAGANGVIVVASALSPGDRKQAVDGALTAGLHVQIWPGLTGLSARRTRMAPTSGVPLLYVEPRAVHQWQLMAKRGIDLALATLLVVLTAPVVAAAALAIKLTDRGPVLYRSQRVGRNGATIQVLKLRTMVQDATTMMANVAQLNERTGGPLFKASNDPRVTRVGGILRSTSIDELPQLWNVLNGTMSLVGPRPALQHEVEHFDSELKRRHEMQPGITGLWQVEARDNPSFSAYRRLDLSYIDDWSLRLDAAIMACTIHQLFARAGKAVIELLSRPKGVPDTTPHPSSGAVVNDVANKPV